MKWSIIVLLMLTMCPMAISKYYDVYIVDFEFEDIEYYKGASLNMDIYIFSRNRDNDTNLSLEYGLIDESGIKYDTKFVNFSETEPACKSMSLNELSMKCEIGGTATEPIKYGVKDMLTIPNDLKSDNIAVYASIISNQAYTTQYLEKLNLRKSGLITMTEYLVLGLVIVGMYLWIEKKG